MYLNHYSDETLWHLLKCANEKWEIYIDIDHEYYKNQAYRFLSVSSEITAELQKRGVY